MPETYALSRKAGAFVVSGLSPGCQAERYERHHNPALAVRVAPIVTGSVQGGGNMASAKITRQWPDGSAVLCEVESDLETVEEVTRACAVLDGLAAPDAES